MERIDRQGIRAVQAGEHAPRLQADPVRYSPAVRDGRSELRRQVLVQRAAQQHVHQLRAPADGQDGLSRGKRRAGEQAVAAVAQGIHVNRLVPDFLPVPGRLYVFAAGRDEAVQPGQDGFRLHSVRQGRQHHGDAAGSLHRLGIGGGELGGAARSARAADADEGRLVGAAGGREQQGQGVKGKASHKRQRIRFRKRVTTPVLMRSTNIAPTMGTMTKGFTA